MKEFWEAITNTWWGITVLCVLCVAVWLLLSAALYRVFFKRLYDILLSGIAIIVFSWLFVILIIVGAIKMKGDPFFTQDRPGRRKKLTKKQCEMRGVPYGTYGEEKTIKLLKFRTMTNEKDARGNLLPDEKRLTRYGKFLRASSLDELPSLFNIFKGDISIVGPRPLLVRYLPYYTEAERHRHDIRPGLTGLAQVNGRNYISWETIFAYDLEYLEKRSLWFDLKIIFKTAYKVIKRADVTEYVQGAGVDDTGRRVYDPFDIERSRKTERHEIGSDFWQYDPNAEGRAVSRSQDKNNVFYYKSGRNALKALCRILAGTKKRVLLPIYTCESVIDPFTDENWTVDFYDIDENFVVDKTSLENKIRAFEPTVVLVQSYYGFDTIGRIGELMTDIKAQGITVVEDITHSLYSSFAKTDADYYIASLRKFFAIPDGGVLMTDCDIADVEKSKSDPAIESAAASAFELKRRYIEDADERVTKDEFRAGYARLKEYIDDNSAVSDISPLSLRILGNADIDGICAARRANYNFVYDNLPNSVERILARASEDVTPLFFPIYATGADERDSLQRYLIEKKIYCPVLWSASKDIPELTQKARSIYDRILCLPIDQRYGIDDMKKIVDAIDEYKSAGGLNG